MAKNSLPNSISINKLCSFLGCASIARAYGVCPKHRMIQLGRFCNVKDCDNPENKKGYCTTHYYRFVRHGSPLIAKRNRGAGKNQEERFWSRVALTADSNKCWEWQGCLNESGYGIICYNRKMIKAHRLAWFYVNKKYPDRLLLHSCDNTKCVNPNHLREGTAKENSADMLLRGRNLFGEKSTTAKLTEVNVKEILKLLAEGKTQERIAKIYNVSRLTISAIKLNRSWKSIPR